MNIVSLLEQQGLLVPQQSAIIHQGQDITFSQLIDRSKQGANLLSDLGLQAGDTILVFIPMSIELYVVLIAIWRLGCTAMFVDPSAGKEKIAQCCQQQKPAAFIGIPKAQILRLLTPTLRSIPIALCTGNHFISSLFLAKPWHKGLNKQATDIALAECQADTPALITFTSGSTGQPKGTVRSHQFLHKQNQVLVQTLQLKAGSTNLATLAIFALINLANGICSLIPSKNISHPAKVDANKVLAEIEKYKPSSAVASPAFFERLLQAKNVSSLVHLEQVFTGGAPVFPHLLRQLQNKMPSTAVCAVFGSTEAEPIAEILFSQMTEVDLQAMAEGKGLLTGNCVEAIDCRIIDDHWGQPIPALTQQGFSGKQVDNGQVGEIVVSGQHVLKSYLGGRGDSDNKFKVDDATWHRTGDLGYFDDQQRLWLLGRCNAKIIASNDKPAIYPFAIETAALQYEEVQRAALCQVNHRTLLAIDSKNSIKQLCLLLAELKSQFQIDELIKLKIPLDKRHNAKVDYPELIKKIEANRGH